MEKSELNPKVDAFLNRSKEWQQEFKKLREIVLDCELTEELKWGKPCYTYEESNVVIIQGFKEYCALLFFKGVLLEDPNGILIRTGENTRVGRQIRFTTVQEITDIEPLLKKYIKAAIEVEKSGLYVNKVEPPSIAIPQELHKKFDEHPDFQAAFDALTPGRQRAYLFYFFGAKQSKTRESRIEKYFPHILNGKGLND